jgi:hypothetical protein
MKDDTSLETIECDLGDKDKRGPYAWTDWTRTRLEQEHVAYAWVGDDSNPSLTND